MQRYLHQVIEYVLSARGKRTLKLTGVLTAIIIAVSLGMWGYVGHVRSETTKTFLRGQDLYLQASGAEAEETRINSLTEAIGLFRAAIAQPLWNVNKAEALLYLADALYTLERYQESIATLRQFQEEFPQSEMMPWVQLKVALAYESLQDYESALSSYGLVVTSHATSPVAPEALLGQARCRELTGRMDEAMKTYENIVSRYPLSSQAQLAQAKLDYRQ